MTLEEHILKAEEDAKMAEFDTEWGMGNYFIDRTESLEYAKECKNLANWLKDYKRLLEQEPKTEWIPVSERLPNDRREVLVTAYWHETYQVMMASYFGDGLWWCVPFNNCGEHTQRLKPKAWMPLPKPYKESEVSE